MSNTIKRVDPREHVLLRPDMYIGSIQPETQRAWLVNPEQQLYIANAKIVPGLYKIFDEIITNASDNKQRDKDRSSSRKMTYIKVNFEETPQGTMITVINDGVQGFLDFNKEEKMYIPQLAFGILMTSSNYNDSEERVTGGRNGFGAKLTNIYSKLFSVEVCEGGKKYFQQWTDNMKVHTEPEITKVASGSTNYVKVSFIPDYARFSLTNLDTDHIALLTRRVYDIAGCCSENLNVFVNNQELTIHNFKQYVQKIFTAACPAAVQSNEAMQFAVEPTEATETTETTTTTKAKRKSTKHWTDDHIAYYEPNEFWSIAVFGSELKEYQQMSFVNSICTSEGGSHVEVVIDNLIEPVNDKVKDYLKKLDIKTTKELTRANIKTHIFLVVRALVVNPSFDSQTKTCLRTTKTQFKKTLTFDKDEKQVKDFFKNIGNMQILMQNLSNMISAQTNKALAKTDGSKQRNIVVPKLDDAVDAGTGNGHRCYLYLTEGDSAKTLAVEGLSKLPDGRRYNGVFPLRGKVLNVRDIAADKVGQNVEITNLKKILGLRQGVDYTDPDNRKQLRYGKVVIMTDQDTDGSHIKGLLLNLFDTFWPSLLQAGYIQEFITPIVRVTRKGGRIQDKIDFYTIPEYELWLADHPNTKDYTTQYYKGLGSSDKAEASQYFKEIQKNKKQFDMDPLASARLNVAFNKKLADKRKEWLQAADPNTYLDNKQMNIKISDFVDRELVLYELENIRRSIPSMIDGMKPSQRKILYGCFKRNLTSPIKVAQLSGYVSEHAAYHHGEVSLNQTIVGLAQSFTGANNIPFLVPKGQFGSRPRGGKDSAAPRYIFTMLQPITRYIFRPEDDQVLNNLKDDNQVIEPEYYVPIIPIVLLNGAVGIGTGWSTNVTQFNPREIINAIRKRLYGKSTKSERHGKRQLCPWFRNWKGVEKIEYFDVGQQIVDRWIMRGTFEVKDRKLVITELPPGVWTEEYRDDLNKWSEEVQKDKESKRPPITLVQDFSDNDRVEIHVTLDKSCTLLDGDVTNPNSPEFKRIIDLFNLESTIRASNMMLHDANNVLQQYKSASHIIDKFLITRMSFYQKRKEKMLEEFREQAIIACEKARFIEMIVKGELKVQNVPMEELCKTLWAKKFMPTSKNRLLMLSNHLEAVDDAEEERNKKDNADELEAEELLRKRVKDIYEREEFFAAVKAPNAAVMKNIYMYLVRLAIHSMTKEKFEELMREKQQAEMKVDELLKKSLEEMYLYDLAALDLALNEFEANLENNNTQKSINIPKSEIEREIINQRDALNNLEDKTGTSDAELENVVPETKKKATAEKKPSLLTKKTAADGEAPKEKKPRAPKTETGVAKAAKPKAEKGAAKDAKPKETKPKDDKPKEPKPKAPKKVKEFSSEEEEESIHLITSSEEEDQYVYVYEDENEGENGDGDDL
ncbi:DNA_topoisomerase 2 [Hexamita inflata]|uniref:DNA topoisomerase 2 n=1 Tax=Hexamita inflata TaxID=28002 RepID=A0AA86NYI3_9EUKA|nr:DNA topoisomerase 2 [Hexamita inflata]